jgi:AcrR family transcriptional regulator
MKDICEASGLSRGGLYRHYSSTRQIFEELFIDMSASQENDFAGKMKDKVPARRILDEILTLLKQEMMDSKNSLSLAFYEYSNMCNSGFFLDLNEKGKKKWIDLINYGMERGEFQPVDAEQIVDIISYSYQGVRMWSRVIPMEEYTIDNILMHIKNVLILK